MKIGIRFTDNDFDIVIRTFLSTLPQLINNCDKQSLVNTFNVVVPELARFSYLTNHGESTHLNNYNNYLQITVDDVYFDNEIDEYLVNYTKWESIDEEIYYWDNSEFHYINLTTGDITTI